MANVQPAGSFQKLIYAVRDFNNGEIFFQKEFVKYKEGSVAFLSAIISAVAIPTLAIYSALYIGGILLPFGIPTACSVVLLTSTILLGPKAVFYAIPSVYEVFKGLYNGETVRSLLLNPGWDPDGNEINL